MRMERKRRWAIGFAVLGMSVAVLWIPENTRFEAQISTPFPDVDSHTLEGSSALYLAAKGIVSGFPDGTFRGEVPVNRAEAAKMLMIASGQPLIAGLTSPFEDVADSAWYAPYIVNAQYLDIVSGFPDGTFHPARGVNRAEFLKMATRIFELPEKLPYGFTDFHAGEWFRIYAGVAWHYHTFPHERTDKILAPGRVMTRDDFAVALGQILTFGTEAHYTGPFRSPEAIHDGLPWERTPWGEAPVEQLPLPLIIPPASSSSTSAPTTTTPPPAPVPPPTATGATSSV